jgi:hypothetical protein
MRKVTNSIFFFENRLFGLFFNKFHWIFVRSGTVRLPLLIVEVEHELDFLQFQFMLWSTVLVHEVLILFAESTGYECKRKH